MKAVVSSTQTPLLLKEGIRRPLTVVISCCWGVVSSSWFMVIEGVFDGLVTQSEEKIAFQKCGLGGSHKENN